jgi:hypothetical protein
VVDECAVCGEAAVAGEEVKVGCHCRRSPAVATETTRPGRRSSPAVRRTSSTVASAPARASSVNRSRRRRNSGRSRRGMVSTTWRCATGASRGESRRHQRRADGPPFTWASLAEVLARRGPDHVASGKPQAAGRPR